MSKILLIDDDPVIIGMYQVLFEAAGYTVCSAEDGETGLAKVLQERPNAVLLDLCMPKLNGLQWLDQIRHDARFQRLPVVIFTAGKVAWQVSAARNADATMVLSKKNADPRKVVESVNNAIQTGSWGLQAA